MQLLRKPVEGLEPGAGGEKVMPIGYAMAIQSTLEVFAFITILIGFANEDKIKAWEHRQWLKIAHRLHKVINRPHSVKARKRAIIQDFDCFEEVWTREPNLEPK